MNAEERQKRLAILDRRASQARTQGSVKRSGEDISTAIEIDDVLEARETKRARINPSDSANDDFKKAITLSVKASASSATAPSLTDMTNQAPKTESPSADSAQSKGRRFWFGEVLLSSARGYTKASHHITIEELLDRDNLHRAVLSSFQIDLAWVLGKMNVGRTEIHIGFHAKERETERQWKTVCAGLPKVFPFFPAMDSMVNCMHSKLQLLVFDDYMRIVFPSANLVPYDWGEDGTMENVMYVQDFPLTSSDLKIPQEVRNTQEEEYAKHEPGFSCHLIQFLVKSFYPIDIIVDLELHDLSRTTKIRFIGSVGGNSYDPRDIYTTGIQRLADVVGSFRVSGNYKIDYITSSVGSLNRVFVSALINACDGQLLYNKMGLAKYQLALQDFKVHFPTTEFVRSSRAGSAGTICFQREYYNKSEFPKESLVQHVPIRPRLLSHCKILVCRNKGNENIGWAYIGSANCSASAWGDRIVKDRAQKVDKLLCRNWETGILVMLDKIKGRLPVDLDHGQVNNDPWFFTESM